ncbi:MAG TPA: DUF58 domain-containing protein [Bryobacteraceae bacterium]|nr:DUF58 domain-containing protein [Bryobacteraceae bacterium]
MTLSLTPDAVEAEALNKGRPPFGFGPHFFIVIAIGFVWLLPLWWSLRFLPLLILWNALAISAWLWDLFRLPQPMRLTVRRTWSGSLILARASTVKIEVKQARGVPVQVFAVDQLSANLYQSIPQFSVNLTTKQPAAYEYKIVPRRRGDTKLGPIFLRYRSTFAFAERWAVAPLDQTVCVMPDLTEAQQQGLYLIRSRQMDIQKRRHRDRGLGREFEALREYRQGDELREICWPATARRHDLITRTFTAERSQTMWVVIDAGRLMRSEIAQPGQEFRLSKLDYSVDAALSLAQVAAQYGDKAGALAYGRTVQQAVAAGRGAAHLREWVNALAHVRAEAAEGNHGLAARVLLQKQNRRALVIWITDFAETPTTPDVVEYAAQLAKKHLVLFVAVSQPDLAAAAREIPETEREMYRGAAALALLQRREILIRSLRQQGVLALELAPGKLTTSLVNEYLSVKERNLL